MGLQQLKNKCSLHFNFIFRHKMKISGNVPNKVFLFTKFHIQLHQNGFIPSNFPSKYFLYCFKLFQPISFTFLQVSFFSTSPELSNKQRFEFFSRTIPSDLYQTIAMGKIVEKLGWKYLSIVYEESNYGIKVSLQLYLPFSNLE